MIPCIRWAKFNLVGALGMVIQLATLARLNRLLHGHYLIASAAALELTLLHNFAWHTQYTWRDRRDGVSRRQQLLRFHLSNGAASLAGNFILMPLLVDIEHLPVLLANTVTILACSTANFWFSHRWTFGSPWMRQSGLLPESNRKSRSTARQAPMHSIRQRQRDGQGRPSVVATLK